MENVRSANAPRESVTRNANENVPRVVGLPVIRRNSAVCEEVTATVELAVDQLVTLVGDDQRAWRVDPDGEGLGVACSGLVLHLDREGEQAFGRGPAGYAAGADTLGEQG
jgi:hypothetical protein